MKTTTEPRQSVELKLIHATGGEYATRIDSDENGHTVLRDEGLHCDGVDTYEDVLDAFRCAVELLKADAIRCNQANFDGILERSEGMPKRLTLMSVAIKRKSVDQEHAAVRLDLAHNCYDGSFEIQQHVEGLEHMPAVMRNPIILNAEHGTLVLFNAVHTELGAHEEQPEPPKPIAKPKIGEELMSEYVVRWTTEGLRKRMEAVGMDGLYSPELADAVLREIKAIHVAALANCDNYDVFTNSEDGIDRLIAAELDKRKTSKPDAEELTAHMVDVLRTAFGHHGTEVNIIVDYDGFNEPKVYWIDPMVWFGFDANDKSVSAFREVKLYSEIKGNEIAYSLVSTHACMTGIEPIDVITELEEIHPKWYEIALRYTRAAKVLMEGLGLYTWHEARHSDNYEWQGVGDYPQAWVWYRLPSGQYVPAMRMDSLEFRQLMSKLKY